MQRTALTRQQSRIHSLLCERMTEGKLFCRYFDHEFGRNQLFDEHKQMVFIAAHHLLQHSKVEAPSCNSRKGDDVHGLRAQLVCPLLHSILHTAWNRCLFAPMIWMWLVLPDPIMRQQFPT